MPGSPLDDREAGVLLHPTSLPGPGHCGVLGREAYRFVDLAQAAGFRVWQTLPVGPVDDTLSPYQLRSAHAGNPRLIDLLELVRAGWLSGAEASLADGKIEARRRALSRAHRRFAERASTDELERLRRFAHDHAAWLDAYGLFEAISRERNGEPWWRWPKALRRRDPSALDAAMVETVESRADIVFEQFLFDRQWARLKSYANDRGIRLFGDLPFYVDRNSVDVWCSRELFRLDSRGRPTLVSGVPPDYFSSDGQLWGHPLYDWARMAETGFRWWAERLRTQLGRFDLIRLDHFRAFESHWAVDAAARTARDGRWIETPGDALFGALAEQLGSLPFVAEDLGLITPEVTALRDRFGLPGLIVLQFAFDGSPENPYLPANHFENAVVYTGTHDNDTTLGWYAGLNAESRNYVAEVLGDSGAMPQALIVAAYKSPARLAVIPMQDLLGLGTEARLNTPGTARGNWRWRFDWGQIDAELAGRYAELARHHGRL